MASPPSPRNRLLASLSSAKFSLLQPHLKPVPLTLRLMLEEPNCRIDHIYFVEEGIVSVVANPSDRNEIEVGLVGPEGMTGLPVILGDDRSPQASYVQAAGTALQIRVAAFRKVMANSPPLHALFLKYAQVFMTQAAQTAVANGRATLPDRLARWILMAQDRIGQSQLVLTHEFLSIMLGVRRPGVTEALATLEGEGLVKSARGTITVLDRKGLERRAKNFYGEPESEYRRLIG